MDGLLKIWSWRTHFFQYESWAKWIRMPTRIYLLPPQWYVSSMFPHTLITHGVVADRTAVTVTFSQYWAEAGPGIAISSNRKNCQLTFGVKYVTPLLYLLTMLIFSLPQSPSRFLIRHCYCRLCEFLFGCWLTGHLASNSRSGVTIS